MEEEGDSEIYGTPDRLHNFHAGRIQLFPPVDSITGGAVQRPAYNQGSENSHDYLDKKGCILRLGMMGR